MHGCTPRPEEEHHCSEPIRKEETTVLIATTYWCVRALHSAASVNLSTEKETITIQIGDTKHLFKVQVMSNKRALKKGEELIKFMLEKDKRQQVEIEPAKKKARCP